MHSRDIQRLFGLSVIISLLIYLYFSTHHMNATDFGLYMTSWAFLESCDRQPSSIIWEEIPAHLMTPSGSTLHTTRESLGYDMSPTGMVMQHVLAYPNTILMLDTLTTQSILPLLSAIAACDAAEHRVVICNVWSGLTGVINKHTLDTHDLTTVMPHLRTVEPCDVSQIHAFLDDGDRGHVYIRVPRDELPETLFPAWWQENHALPYMSLQAYGYTGDYGTIVTNGALLPHVSQVLQYMHTQTEKRFDLFVVTDYSAPATQELRDSIDQNGRLVIIHDAADIETLAPRRTACQITGSPITNIKLPSYQKLTTFLPAYMYDVADMGQESLVTYLTSI